LAGSVVSPLRREAAIGVTGAGVGLGIVAASALAGLLHRASGDALSARKLPVPGAGVPVRAG
jgi:hypothetical protein